MLMDHVDFELSEIGDPRLAGRKALAVNLSDLAAMGARPRAVLLSVALVALIYLTMNIAIIGVVPWTDVMTSKNIAAEFMERLYGRPVAVGFTILILWTVVACMFAITLGYSRIPYAAAVRVRSRERMGRSGGRPSRRRSIQGETNSLGAGGAGASHRRFLAQRKTSQCAV